MIYNGECVGGKKLTISRKQKIAVKLNIYSLYLYATFTIFFTVKSKQSVTIFCGSVYKS